MARHRDVDTVRLDGFKQNAVLIALGYCVGAVGAAAQIAVSLRSCTEVIRGTPREALYRLETVCRSILLNR